jgi:dephospho-CoA kinase
MLRVGLTGGIASGKSTVATMLRNLACPVLEADPLGHELLKPGQAAYDDVVREFGTEILSAEGGVDREKLGKIVFADPAKRGRLNWILHPRILEAIQKWFTELDHPGGPAFAFMVAALIYEAGVKKDLDYVVVCWCPAEQQMERLRERGLSAEQAQRRIAAQMPVDEKRRLADETIDCSGSVEETESQLARVIEKLKQLAASKK